MPKIVFGVTSGLSVQLLGKLPNEMALRGWQVHVVSGAPSPKSASAEKGAVTFHVIPMVREPELLRDLQSLLRWWVLLAKLRPDVLSVGTPKASLLALLVGWLLRIPVRVYVLRGLRVETLRGYRYAAFAAAERLTAGLATAVQAVSPSLQRVYLDKKLTSQTKISYLHFGSSKGVDLAKFRPANDSDKVELVRLRNAVGLTAASPVVGVFGRQGPDKGIDVLVESLEILAQQSVQLQVLFVGEDEGSRSRLTDLHLPTIKLTFLDHSPALELYYRLLDVLCLPTLREGLPNVALEAQASGVPVITTDATGAVDSLAPGRTGLVAKKGDPLDLAEKLKLVLTEDILRDSLSQNARFWVSEHFDERDVIDESVKFYSWLAGDNMSPN